MSDEEIEKLRSFLSRAHEEHMSFPRRIMRAIKNRLGARIEKRAILHVMPPPPAPDEKKAV
jgi:hypothetical protein